MKKEYWKRRSEAADHLIKHLTKTVCSLAGGEDKFMNINIIDFINLSEAMGYYKKAKANE